MHYGKAATKVQAAYHNDLCCIVGCVVCRKFYNSFNPICSIHHIDGRTKPHAHWLVLSLCAGHHQQGTGENKNLIARHPDRDLFEAKYDTELNLWLWQFEVIKYIPDGVRDWQAAGFPGMPDRLRLDNGSTK